jgi:propanediol dehydratase medium subunit
VVDPRELVEADPGGDQVVVETGEAVAGKRGDEVVIAVGPAFGDRLRATINGLEHADVLAAIREGIREGGAEPRLVRVRRSSDVAFIGHDGALLSGSGIAVGLQSKGTAVIHRADLEPLDNLELFGMSPLYSLDSYRAMGRNAAGYALGKPVGPVSTLMDNYARAKLIVKTTLLHARETAAIVPGASAVELELSADAVAATTTSAGQSLGPG